MRKALNDNPMVQAAVIGVFGLAFAFILYSSVLKGDSPPPANDPAATPPSGIPSTAGDAAGLESGAPAPTTDPAAPPVASAPPATAAPAPAVPPTASGGNLVPTKGLPSDVLVPLAKGRAVALLVIEPKGITDKKLSSYVGRLEDRGDVEVIVTKAERIGRYSRITQGVSVSQVPALVVVSPRDRASGGLTASVTYGFRSAQSLEQAVDDALYKGKTVTPYPE